MAKKYVLKLMADERVELEQLVKRGKAAAWKVQRAQALLKCDQGPVGPAWTDEQSPKRMVAPRAAWNRGANRPSNAARCPCWSGSRARRPSASWMAKRKRDW